MKIKRVKENPFYSGCDAQINCVLIECVVRPTFDIYQVDLGFKTMVTLILLSIFFLDLPWQSTNVEANIVGPKEMYIKYLQGDFQLKNW